MGHTNGYQRLAWHDRFNEPIPETLRDSLPGATRRLFDQIRADLAAIEGVQERMSWYGECWRWSIEYRSNVVEEPVALLIPSPEDLQVGVPFPREFTDQLNDRSLKRSVRDGLELAQEPFDTRWGVWSIQHAGIWKDIKSLIQKKLNHLRNAAT